MDVIFLTATAKKYSALERVHATREVVFKGRATRDGAILMHNVRRGAGPFDKVADEQIADPFRPRVRLSMVLQKHLGIALKNANRFEAFRAIAVGRMEGAGRFVGEHAREDATFNRIF